MSVLTITDLSHSFGDKELYRSASLELNKGEHMGVVGQNGSGKSTLLRLLLGELSPTGGRIVWQENASVGHLDQHAQIDERLTLGGYLRTAFDALYALEAKLSSLYAQMRADTPEKTLRRAAAWQEALEARGFYRIDSEVARVASGLGLSSIGMERTIGTLSGGQRTKAILARLLLTAPEVLLLDEPTNFLDAEHIQWLSQFLSAFPGSFMIVSHDSAFLSAITACICDIEQMTLTKYIGGYQDFVRQKAHRHEAYLHRYQAQQREVAKLEEYIARNRARASTARMAQSRVKKLEKIDRLAPTTVAPKPAIAFPSLPLPSARALDLHALRVGYDRPLLPPISFSVPYGQKVVLKGFNGIGKSTLLKTLMGIQGPLGGSYAFSPSVTAGYFEQDLRWEDHAATPLALLCSAYPTLTPQEVRRALARCGVRAEHVLRPLETLSGGEQNKVKLCRLTMTATNFLLLDEPTNHLDAETKESLRDALAAYQGGILLVCHEAAFYEPFADRVVDFEALAGLSRISEAPIAARRSAPPPAPPAQTTRRSPRR